MNPIADSQLVTVLTVSCGTAGLHKLDTCKPQASRTTSYRVGLRQSGVRALPVHCRTGLSSKLPFSIMPTASGVSDAAISSGSSRLQNAGLRAVRCPAAQRCADVMKERDMNRPSAA